MFALFLTFIALGQVLIGVAGDADPIAKITVGSSLHFNTTAGQNSWRSPSGRFAFGFYKEDDQRFSVGIILYHSGVNSFRIWTAKAYQLFNPVCEDVVLSFTEQGFLLTPSNASKSIALIKFNGTASTRAAMLDNGNFVVYNSNASTITETCSSISAQIGRDVNGDSCVVWQSFDHPTDAMVGGQALNCGTSLSSHFLNIDNSFYKLSMQCDSNLVLYTVKVDGNVTTETKPIWTSQTSGRGYKKLLVGEDGRLFLSNPNGTDQYTLAKYNPKDGEAKMLYIAALVNDKYFKLYALNLGTNITYMVFEIPTLYACQIEYFCGENSYCVVVNNTADCRCLPGFSFNDLNDSTKGCHRSVAEPNCWPPGSSDTVAFSMEQVDNLVWHDDAYSIVSADSKEACGSSCLTECNCEAAVFFNQKCAKHKLPMRSATIGTNFTSMSTAYMKIAAMDNGGKAEEKLKRKRYLMAVLLCGTIDAGVFLALLVAGAGSYWLFYGRYRLLWRKWELAFQEEVAPRSFSYEELARATNSFSSELGRGGHATVFKGYLTMYGKPDPVPVAVKRLSLEEGKGDSDFQAEIRIIGRAHHVNLVRLLGFCYEESNRLLIYEYMSRGSLADLICQSGPPSWKQQARILLDVAQGINYLHRECETKIIHRDIKPENILIAENWRVKISDFGISKLLLEGNQATYTKRTSAPGTHGYVAPECIQSNGRNLTEKADVYSFGIVVLETVFWERNTGDNSLLKSARKYCQDKEAHKKEELADAELEKDRMAKLGMKENIELANVQLETVKLGRMENMELANVQLEMVKLGILCVQEMPDARPDMEEVILPMLEEIVAVPSPAAAVTPQIVTSGGTNR